MSNIGNLSKVQKLTLAGILVALGVVLSPLSIPIGAARVFPAQHALNVIGGVVLGPAYAVVMAFATSVLRNLLGTGTLLAFPGSMFGALLAGLTYKYMKEKLSLACVGELIGTGVLGALVAFPVAALVMGREVATFAFVIPFVMSSLAGGMIAFVLLGAFVRIGVFPFGRTRKPSNGNS